MPYLFLTLLLVSTVAGVIFLFKPALLNKLIKKSLSRKRIAVIFSTMIFLSFFMIGATISDEPVQNTSKIEEKTQKETTQEEITQPEPPQINQPINFKVAKEEDFNIGTLTRKNFRIVMSAQAGEDEIKRAINEVIATARRKDENIDEISVLVYDRIQDINGAYTMAKGDWAYNGQWGKTSQEAGLSNDRVGYKVSYDIKSRKAGKPNDIEMEVYDHYWDILNEPGNPIGYVEHPFRMEDANSWERERMERVAKKYSLSEQQLEDIIAKVVLWQAPR